VISIATIIVLLIVALVFAYLMFRNTKVMMFINNRTNSAFLKALLTILDFLYMPAKKVTVMAGGNDMMIDVVGTEIRNILFRNTFAQVPYNERIIVVPQCLRSAECPAKFNSIEGAKCMECGKCKIKEISKRQKNSATSGYTSPPEAASSKE